MLGRKVTKVGNSLGVTLPKEVVDRLKIKEGDTLYLAETQRGFEISPYDEEFVEQVEAAESVIRRYRNALKELAK